MKEVTKLVGSNPGQTSVVLVGVHGNEVCGVNALAEILPELTITSGTVFFIVGNPNAVADNVRFTEFNLNRAFKPDNLLRSDQKNSYEYHRAQFLKRYLDQASALLDIHSSNTPESLPFVICENNALNIAKGFPVEITTSGFDRVNPGGTDYYMNQMGKVGICIECGYHSDRTAPEIAQEAIRVFLGSRGHIVHVQGVIPKQRKIEVRELYYAQYGRFIPAHDWRDFEYVPKDTLIGFDGDKAVIAEDNSVLLFVRNCDIGGEAFYLAIEE